MRQYLGGRVTLPNIDETAKAWETSLSKRVGKAIQARRKTLGLTAQQLAELTKKFRYPITRVAISKIEGNSRAGKFDLAELLVLAAALEISPALLVFPGFPDGSVEVLPDRTADNEAAVKWLGGRSGDGQIAADHDGTALVEAVAKRRDLAGELYDLQTRRGDGSWSGHVFDLMLREKTAQLATTEENIRRTTDQLWGANNDG
jgi:transcriptional regulator with XRE-family HTH domain